MTMIDWQRVNELRDEVGNDDFPEIVTVFLDEVNEVIDRITNHITQEDMHFLKGSAWTLGFSETGTLCRDGEEMMKAEPPKIPVLEPILAAFQAERAELLTDPSLSGL
jgi:HPt (histidine-containing phosphotransfer) domain-containing protein